MERVWLRTIPGKRTSSFVLAAFVVVATALCWGPGITWAEQASSATKPDPFAAKRAADAKKARAKRDAAVKRREESKKYLKQVIESQGAGTATPAPIDQTKGGKK
jgi:hypothetical protein